MDDLLKKYERLLVDTNNDMLPLKVKILKSQEFDYKKFDVIAFAKRKLIKKDPNNIDYL